jgi:redox-sensing transcriptional repressor
MAGEIPDIVIGRLPVYLRALNHLAQSGQLNTSSHELGRRLGISSAQIRKDLSHFGEFGKQGTGYHIEYLIEQLRTILHLDKQWPVAIVGAGYLGHALAHYQGFKERGFRIVRVFDNHPARYGEKLGRLVVQHTDEMEEAIRRDGIRMAIMAVPASAAQLTADTLVKAGVTAILNYAPINLTVPPSVEVRYSDPLIQMQQMSYYLGESENEGQPEVGD